MVFVLEVLGLGLGVAPLMIEFFKANPAPINAIGSLRRKSAHETMDDFYINLGYEMFLFRFTLCKLVEDLPIDEETKAKLMGDTTFDSNIWKRPSPDLQHSLECRLGSCLGTFEQCMEKILCLLAKLVKDSTLPMPIPSGTKRVFTGKSYEKLEEVYDSGIPLSQRFKFGWKKEKRDKLMDGISKYNRKLEQMLEKTYTTTPSYSSTRPAATSGCVPHLGLRERMAELCQAIRKVWCDCTGQHELRFGLHQEEIDEAHITLDMLMNLSKDNESFRWGESKMKIYLQRETTSNAIKLPTMQSQPRGRRHSSWTGTTFVDSPLNSPLRDTPPSISSSYSSQISEITIRDVNSPVQTEVDMSKPVGSSPVNNMCKIVGNYQRQRRKSEIIFRDKELVHRQLDTSIAVRHSHPGVALVEYLQKTQRWTLQDRKTLQVLLAHSVLFFPWKGSDLNKNTIVFHHEPMHGSLDKPFAALKPGHGAGDVAKSRLSEPEDSYQPYPHETLAALATVLLEIELQKPIEAMMIDEDRTDNDIETKFWATARVLEEQKGNMFLDCWKSIDACLRCDFTEGEANLDDKAFLEQVYERVIAPLEHELWRGFNVRLPATERAGYAAPPVTKIAARMEVGSTEMIEAAHIHGPRRSVRVSNDSNEIRVHIPHAVSDSGSDSS